MHFNETLGQQYLNDVLHLLRFRIVQPADNLLSQEATGAEKLRTP